MMKDNYRSKVRYLQFTYTVYSSLRWISAQRLNTVSILGRVDSTIQSRKIARKFNHNTLQHWDQTTVLIAKILPTTPECNGLSVTKNSGTTKTGTKWWSTRCLTINSQQFNVTHNHMSGWSEDMTIRNTFDLRPIPSCRRLTVHKVWSACLQ